MAKEALNLYLEDNDNVSTPSDLSDIKLSPTEKLYLTEPVD
ncbi:hypothetical protein [Paenibacillus mangrovi]|nr:hypothetical protein [Paenibacillus mangrovi]